VITAVRRSAARCLAASFVGLLVASPCAAQKRTDVVVLRSGDRITCEIKNLQYGYLEVETDSLGTLSVVWSDVGELSSTHHFVVEVSSGRRYAGSLRSPAEGRLEVGGATAPPLDLRAIVAIRPDREAFLARIDGSVQLSFNVAKANNQKQWALGGDGRYNGLSWFDVVSLSSTFTSQEGSSNTSRNSLSIQSGRFLGPRWLYAGIGTLQQDDELGLQRRVAGGAGIGRTVLESNRRSLEILSGLDVTNERFESVQGTQTNLEAFGLARYEGFRRRSPKLDVILTFVLLPSITDPGRVHGELQVSTSIEMFHNFYVGLNGFDSFDSRPPEATLQKNDYGVTPSLRWKF
jgi:uncharacterized protein DUF481